MPAALLLAARLFAGQSLVLSPNSSVTLTDPPYPANQSWRVEFQLHSFTLPTSATPPSLIQLAGVGFAAYLGSDGRLLLESLWDQVYEQSPCYVNTTGFNNVLVRFQRNVSTMQVTCELWNYDSTGYNTQTDHISKLATSPYGGGQLGGNISASLGFLRVNTTVLPLGSRPPATADTGNWTDLRFDGNLHDSSGNGHGGTGPAFYMLTPNQVSVSLPKTLGAPFWSNWTSLRAGFPAQLDGSASYTLADGSASVSCFWQQLSGPSTVIWQNRSAATPTITGLIFGSYTFQLQVTDAAGNISTATLEVGAVATDSNGIVVQANPAADQIFGPMIAFGKNPWGYADYRNLTMENLQKNTYATPPSWANPPENATVSYTFLGNTGPITTLAANTTATALTLSVTSTAGLDLSTMPTQILVGNNAAWEIVRICSAAGTTLNVCYDGRAYHYGINGTYVRGATAWSSGAGVWQAKVTGSGTHFLRTMCSLGPGSTVMGSPVPLTTGAVRTTPGSVNITGVGTAWTNSQTSYDIEIFGTHNSIPFTFLSYVSSVGGATSITLSRAWPSDADSGTFSYAIFGDQRNAILHYTRPDSTDGYIYFPTSGCESDTTLYLYLGWDNGYANQHQAASPYSYIDGLGYAGDFSPNYYDMGLAHYAFYFRSGMSQALTSARNIEDYWLRYPEIAQGDAGGNPRDRGILGVVAAAVLDGDRASNWSGLRTFAQQGLATALQNYCDADLRETAYQLSWLALAAQFDPIPAQRANWQAGVAGASYTRDSGCKRPDNSFATGFYWNPPALQIAATQGSTTATPVNGTFPSNMCYSTASGTAVVSNGSAMLTALSGSFVPPAGSYKLLVGGTIGGVRYDLATQFDYNSFNSLTMGAKWPGDSGLVYWSIEDNDNSNYILSIAQGPNDTANFGQITSCTLLSPTQIQLYRPWPTASGTFGYTYYNLVGRGTQSFMAGIKALQMRYAGQVYSPYQSLDQAIANWVGTTGFDASGTKGIYYGRVFPQCEPAVTDSGITDVAQRVMGCIEDSFNPSAASQARARNSEAQNAMTVNYLADPNSTNQLLGDEFYGAVFGATGYTASGYWTDGLTASNLDDVSLGSYKWPGFFFGVGMAHQWPAARLGGVAPPQYRTVSIGLNIPSGQTAQAVVYAPSGAVTTYQCGSVSPCSVTVDDRQGSHWLVVQYLSSSGSVVSQTDPNLLNVSGQ